MMKKLEDYSKEKLPYVVNEMMAKHDTGFISGHRNDRARSENNEIELKISTYLKYKGYFLAKVRGSHVSNHDYGDAEGVAKESFFVVDVNDTGDLKEELIRLGGTADQDSIIFIKKGAEKGVLIGNSRRDDASTEWDRVVEIRQDKNRDSSSEFFIKIREGKIVCEPIETANTYFGKMGHNLLAKKVEKEIESKNERYLTLGWVNINDR